MLLKRIYVRSAFKHIPDWHEESYTQENTEMIVSRGIGNSIIPLRINNKPEIVIAELTHITANAIQRRNP